VLFPASRLRNDRVKRGFVLLDPSTAAPIPSVLGFMDSKVTPPLTTDNLQFTVYPYTIRSFKHRGLKRLYERGDRSGIGPDLLEAVERIITVLDSATTPQALDIPRYRLHPLKGDLKGFWSVTVRANWRIVFRFEATDAFDVELIDYH